MIRKKLGAKSSGYVAGANLRTAKASFAKLAKNEESCAFSCGAKYARILCTLPRIFQKGWDK